jgi:hypothetical protein
MEPIMSKIQLADGTEHDVRSLSINSNLHLVGEMHICFDRDNNCIISDDDVVMMPRAEYLKLKGIKQ